MQGTVGLVRVVQKIAARERVLQGMADLERVVRERVVQGTGVPERVG